MKQRAITLFLALLLLSAVCLPVSAAEAPYDPNAALEFASQHWCDGIGQCAEFVSRCLRAGGCGCYSMRCSELVSMLQSSGLCKEYTLPVNDDMSVTVPDDPSILAPGDAVFFRCSAQGEYQHAVLYAGADENGYMRVYAHTGSNNATYRYIYSPRCPECGQASIDTVTVMHFTVNDAPTQPELNLAKGVLTEAKPIGFTWEETDNTTHYDLYIERQNENGEYEKAVRMHDVDSGCQYPLETGSFRVWVRSVNEAALIKKGKTTNFSESEKCSFTVGPASPVVKPAEARQPAAVS